MPPILIKYENGEFTMYSPNESGSFDICFWGDMDITILLDIVVDIMFDIKIRYTDGFAAPRKNPEVIFRDDLTDDLGNPVSLQIKDKTRVIWSPEYAALFEDIIVIFLELTRNALDLPSMSRETILGRIPILLFQDELENINFCRDLADALTAQEKLAVLKVGITARDNKLRKLREERALLQKKINNLRTEIRNLSRVSSAMKSSSHPNHHESDRSKKGFGSSKLDSAIAAFLQTFLGGSKNETSRK